MLFQIMQTRGQHESFSRKNRKSELNHTRAVK